MVASFDSDCDTFCETDGKDQINNFGSEPVNCVVFYETGVKDQINGFGSLRDKSMVTTPEPVDCVAFCETGGNDQINSFRSFREETAETFPSLLEPNTCINFPVSDQNLIESKRRRVPKWYTMKELRCQIDDQQKLIRSLRSQVLKLKIISNLR